MQSKSDNPGRYRRLRARRKRYDAADLAAGVIILCAALTIAVGALVIMFRYL